MYEIYFSLFGSFIFKKIFQGSEFQWSNLQQKSNYLGMLAKNPNIFSQLQRRHPKEEHACYKHLSSCMRDPASSL